MRRVEWRLCALELATMLLSAAWDASVRVLTAENSIANDLMYEHAKGHLPSLKGRFGT